MTPREAEGWAMAAATWVCVATSGEGSQHRLKYLAECTVCRYLLGNHRLALEILRERLVLAKAHAQITGNPERQLRLLLIFLRRLTRHVDGWTPPRCGRCSDTGVIHHRHYRDVWPVACWRCQPEEHGRQMSFRLEAWERARRCA